MIRQPHAVEPFRGAWRIRTAGSIRQPFREHPANGRNPCRARCSRWLAGHFVTALVCVSLVFPAAAEAGRSEVVPVIRKVFGRYADQAIRIVDCETGGTFSIYASNRGVYLGLFQFGPYARRTYGFGWTALAQTQAAWRYFKASGYRWTAWECKP